jgi:hypothetical protein
MPLVSSVLGKMRGTARLTSGMSRDLVRLVRRLVGDFVTIAGMLVVGIGLLFLLFAAAFYLLGWDRLEFGPPD